MSGILLICGVIVLLAGFVMFLIVAFRASLLWGIACLLFAPAELIFLILHWAEAKKPWFIQLIGGTMIMIGVYLTTGSIPLTSVPSGNYDLTGQILNYTPNPIYVGDTVHFEYLVKNIGEDTIPDHSYKVELYVNKNLVMADSYTLAIEPGDRFGVATTKSSKFIPKYPGEYTYTLIISPRKGLIDINTSNNEVTGKIIVKER